MKLYHNIRIFTRENVARTSKFFYRTKYKRVNIQKSNKTSPILTHFVIPLQKFGGVNSKLKIPPFLTCFPHRRSPSAYFEGTHGVRFAWGNTDAIDFVAIASSLQATNGGRVVGNTNRLKAVPLVHGRKNPHSPVHLYYPSSSALASSPPCGSRSVFESTHSVYK